MMRRFCIGMSLVLAAATIFAQGGQPSPKETATATFAGKTITILYCSPRVQGREGHIFNPGGLIQQTHKSYPVWRAGANAATTLKTSGEISLGNLKVPAGTHTLFVDISNPQQWKLIVSDDTGEWGLSYDKSKDLGSVPMHMSKPPAMVEDLKYTIKKEGDHKGTLTLAWENESASVPITVD
jgi:hypothetical protein